MNAKLILIGGCLLFPEGIYASEVKGYSADGSVEFRDETDCHDYERELEKLGKKDNYQAALAKLESSFALTESRVSAIGFSVAPVAAVRSGFFARFNPILKEPPLDVSAVNACGESREKALRTGIRRLEIVAEFRDWVGKQVWGPLYEVHGKLQDREDRAPASQGARDATRAKDALFELECRLFWFHAQLMRIEDELDAQLKRTNEIKCASGARL